MKTSHTIPDNLKTNLKNSLDFYRNIFNYKNILLVSNEGNKFSVLLQANENYYSKFHLDAKKLIIKDNVYHRENQSKKSLIGILCDHF